ncbi:putative secreted protein (Por secretion system target) [Lacinutrix venerupis]|uniref:T9SS type A sorting domain-containing protein n=1 Tax=Lacinutrix venerupis TaxID=1486034 RepID=UPI000EAD368B|nr:T9SS type A sorting domain-containing protein [Lacinutrix venerupis]RLJ61994.1 putative secreted protein (Por secretion system target) [Lacinutrix venerupis]
MKKITLFFILLTASFSFGQVVLSEDFNSSLTIPAGWSNNDIAAAGDTWTIEDSGEAALAGAGNTLIFTTGGADGNYAAFDSDGTSDNSLPENVALESPIFSCAALTQVTLEYNHLFAGNFGGEGLVEVSADGGTTWNNVATYNADNYAGGLITADVTTELAGASSAQVRFRWTGDFSVAWYVDNVSVYQCAETAAPSCVTPITPIDGETSAGTGNGTDIDVTFSWTTDPNASSYELFINNFSQGIRTSGVTFSGFTPSTAYTWSVVPSNCFGEATGCATWNFTTNSDISLSTEEFELNNSISHFFNTDTNNLTLTSSTLPFSSVELYSILGQQVLSKKLSQTNESLNLSHLNDGIYIAKVSIEGKTETIKFVKK